MLRMPNFGNQFRETYQSKLNRQKQVTSGGNSERTNVFCVERIDAVSSADREYTQTPLCYGTKNGELSRVKVVDHARVELSSAIDKAWHRITVVNPSAFVR